ncbi:hypothetical protein PDJAM_G00005210 [Pangasius djambal]|uniref:Uncharacterized protein n=1 Tax=Pangasius djambal TaxID=1691987 RepID=A0ACC5XYF9_9TELE|nr:hypothetical protein [Pangasius djambal]
MSSETLFKTLPTYSATTEHVNIDLEFANAVSYVVS